MRSHRISLLRVSSPAHSNPLPPTLNSPLPEYWINPPASGLKLRTPHHGPILVGIKCEPSVNVSLRGHSYRRRELHMLGARWVVTVTLMDAKSVVSLPSRTRLKRETAVDACGGSCDRAILLVNIGQWIRGRDELQHSNSIGSVDGASGQPIEIYWTSLYRYSFCSKVFNILDGPVSSVRYSTACNKIVNNRPMCRPG